MKGCDAIAERDILEAFAAELTRTAYAVALRHGAGIRWLDLQLDLWKSLKESVKKCGQERQWQAVAPEQ